MTSGQLSQADKYAADAAEISRAQGLPAGQYDFSKLSKNQLNTVMSDMMVNKGVDPAEMRGLLACSDDAPAPTDNEPVDWTSRVTAARDYERWDKNAINAAHMQITLGFYEFVASRLPAFKGRCR